MDSAQMIETVPLLQEDSSYSFHTVLKQLIAE